MVFRELILKVLIVNGVFLHHGLLFSILFAAIRQWLVTFNFDF